MTNAETTMVRTDYAMIMPYQRDKCSFGYIISPKIPMKLTSEEMVTVLSVYSELIRKKVEE